MKMSARHDGKVWSGRKMCMIACLVFTLLGGVREVIGTQADAQERIVLRGVPYFCQKWHFD